MKAKIKMKKLNKVLALVLLFGVLISTPTTAKAWEGGDHKERVESIVKNKIKNVNFSEQELQLLYLCSQLPDKEEYRWLDYKGGTQVKSLHGGNNYMVTIKYLYELSLSYLSCDSRVQNDSAYIDNYLSTRNYIGDQTDVIKQVNTILVRLLDNENVYYSDNMEKTNRKKAIKIFGFLCHTIGDTYAHSSIVPSPDLCELEIDANSFTNDGIYSKDFKMTIMEKITREYEISFVDLDNLATGKVKDRQTGKTLPLQEIALLDTKMLDSMSKDLVRKKYEDNKNFYRKRFDATYTVTRRLLEKFNVALLQKENGEQINISFDVSDMKYYDEKIYKLRKYDKFLKSIGG